MKPNEHGVYCEAERVALPLPPGYKDACVFLAVDDDGMWRSSIEYNASTFGSGSLPSIWCTPHVTREDALAEGVSKFFGQRPEFRKVLDQSKFSRFIGGVQMSLF